MLLLDVQHVIISQLLKLRLQTLWVLWARENIVLKESAATVWLPSSYYLFSYCVQELLLVPHQNQETYSTQADSLKGV